MKKIISRTLSAIALSLTALNAVHAEESCFQVSKSPKAWSKTPERICIAKEDDSESKLRTLTFLTGMPGLNETVVGDFRLELLQEAKCLDCRSDVYGLSIPSNSVFNELKIVLKGTRDPQTGAESGTVRIGKTKLFYRGRP